MTENGEHDDARLTIGQVTAQTGLSVHALRFYERQGLLPDPVGRSRGGHRVYTESDVEWIRNCARFRASGMPVAKIRRFVELVRGGPGNEEQRLELLRRHQQVVMERIAELTGYLKVINDKVSAYEESLAACSGRDPWCTPRVPARSVPAPILQG